MVEKASLYNNRRAVPAATQSVDVLSRLLGFKVNSLTSQNRDVLEVSISTSGSMARLPERTRMFGRYLSLVFGKGVAVSTVDASGTASMFVDTVPANVSLESKCGQLNGIVGNESRLSFAVNAVLGAAQCRGDKEKSERVQLELAEIGFPGAVVDTRRKGNWIKLVCNEGVFGEERFCKLLRFLGTDEGTRYIVRLNGPDDLYINAARSLGGQLVPASFNRDLSKVGVCHPDGAFDSVDFCSRTGLSPTIMGSNVSPHASLRGLLQATLVPCRSQIRSWWVVDKTFFLQLRSDASDIENLSALKSGLNTRGYDLQVQRHERGFPAIAVSPLSARFFVEIEGWAQALTAQIKQHTGLNSRLWMPECGAHESPRLTIEARAGRALMLLNRVLSNIAEGLIPFPIEIQCSRGRGAELHDIKVEPKLICMGAPAGVFVHSVDQESGRCGVKMSLIESDSVDVARIYGEGVIDNSVVVGKGLVVEEDVVSSTQIDGDEYTERVLRVAGALERSGRDSQCVVIGRGIGRHYRVYLPGINGMGLVFSNSHLTCRMSRCKVLGVHRVLKCPVLELR